MDVIMRKIVLLMERIMCLLKYKKYFLDFFINNSLCYENR